MLSQEEAQKLMNAEKVDSKELRKYFLNLEKEGQRRNYYESYGSSYKSPVSYSSYQSPVSYSGNTRLINNNIENATSAGMTYGKYMKNKRNKNKTRFEDDYFKTKISDDEDEQRGSSYDYYHSYYH